MTSIRVRHSLRVLCCLFVLTAHPLGSAGQGVKDVRASARRGNFVQAFAQSREVIAANPTADDVSTLRTLFSKYPQIQDSGVTAISVFIHAARTEQDLLRAQSQVLVFARCVKSNVCAAGAMTGLQTRFAAVASKLVLDTEIPLTFESNLLADWAASTGSELDRVLERRLYENTMANIAARDPRDTPSALMADRLFRYLLREPDAREEAFATVEKVQWQQRDLDGPLREVYPEFASKRRRALGIPESNTRDHYETAQSGSSLQPEAHAPTQSGTGQYGSAVNVDTKGVEFGPWVRRFIAQIKKNWIVPYAAMSRRGHVSVSFNVHKDGTITDIVVASPCKVDTFNTSSYNAIAASNPTVPIPPEYPEEKAFFTVTFYYNETPPQK